ncbi:hypothetical protein D3C76_1273180 [compost metagenome]
MPGRVITDDVDDRGVGATRVVQVGNAIGKAWPQVSQGHRRLAGNPAIAVRSTGAHPFEQGQHRFEGWRTGHGCHQGNFSRSGIGEAVFDTARHRRFHYQLRTIHFQPS